MSRAIWWIRRDLRLEDNTALDAALAHADEVIPLFILDDRLLVSARLSGPRVAWMLDGLSALDADLRRRGSSLVVRRGDPARELLAICADAGA
ncbi:MAG TPA: deoxyribodipyrimidine photo-lyase, partial [Ktedonobacterales bacterium]|nr:deoxyribodipyrimidine photo-lyase [Ktedonobacterales bacterium]